MKSKNHAMRIQWFARLSWGLGICLSALLLISAACATTYYVATDGNDGWDGLAPVYDPGTGHGPWALIDNGDYLDLLQPGDTVEVQAGTYVPLTYLGFTFMNSGGTPGNPITYRVNGRVIIDWANASGHNLGFYAHLGNAHDIVIDGFEISGCPYPIVIDDGAARVTVRNCYFHHLYPEEGSPYGALHPIWVAATSDNTFYRNVFDLSETTNHPASGFAITASSNTRIINNTFLGGSNAVRVGGNSSGTLFVNNIVAQMRECGIANWDSVTAVTNSHNVYNNVQNFYGVIQGVGEFDAAPLLDSDYLPQANSPVINMGKDMGAGFTDFNGPAPDIGAKESTATGSPGKATGLVKNTDGTPIAGATVAMVGTLFKTTSGSTGAYELALPQGTYTLRASKVGRVPAEASVTITLGAAKLQDFILAAAPRGVLKGTVYKAGTPPTPLYGVRVESLTEGRAYLTGPDGYYELDLAEGPHEIKVSILGAVTIQENVTIVAGQTLPRNYVLTPGGGKTYYVSTAGNDDWDGLSPTFTAGTNGPWAHIHRGDELSILMPADIVTVQAGTYPQPSYLGADLKNCGGNAIAPITYKADGRVLIDWANAGGHNLGIYVHGAYSGKMHDLVIDGFEIARCPFPIVVDDGAARIIVQNCYIRDIYPENGVGLGVCWNAFASDVTYRNNVFDNRAFAGAGDAVAGLSLAGCPNTHVYNNTFVGGDNALRPWMGSTGTRFVNNIVRDMWESGIGNWDALGAVLNSYNIFFNNTTDYGGNISPGTGEFNADPKLVGGTPFDFHLQESSPAVDAGTNLGIAYQGSAPDLGAYESPYSAATECTRIDEVKALGAGTSIKLISAKVVTVASGTFSDGSYYIEEDDRTSGIKVKPETTGLPSVAVGQAITLSGVVRVDANGEKYIGLTAVTPTTGAAVGALGMTNKSLTSAQGKAKTGLLVRIWGLVTVKTAGYIYVDDGSGYDDGSSNGPGVRVMLSGLTSPITKSFSAGVTFVMGVTGAASLDAGGIPCVRPRGDADIDL